MRSSKSRSRNKNNRNKPQGNVINRVFDSSGPEGKVRGTPQQIIDKYNQLARDAQLAGDRVATENFQQHAEHYLRLLSEAQREQDAKREEQERANRERQAQRDRERQERIDRQEREANTAGHDPLSHDPGEAPQPDVTAPPAAAPDVIETSADDAGLVETPEDQAGSVAYAPADPSPAAEEAPKPKPRRRTRKPKAETKKTDTTEADATPASNEGEAPEAAE